MKTKLFQMLTHYDGLKDGNTLCFCGHCFEDLINETIQNFK